MPPVAIFPAAADAAGLGHSREHVALWLAPHDHGGRVLEIPREWLRRTDTPASDRHRPPILEGIEACAPSRIERVAQMRPGLTWRPFVRGDLKRMLARRR